MLRMIDTSALPRKPYGRTTHIDWNAAVGQRIPFQYDELSGELTVLAHEPGNFIVVAYGGKQKRLRTHQLMDCKFRDLLYSDPRMLKEIDFSAVPLRYGRYDWVRCAGAQVPFLFNGIRGTLHLTGYQSERGMGYVLLTYQGIPHRIRTINLLNGKIGGIVGIGQFHFSVGQRLTGVQKDITILRRMRQCDPDRRHISRKRYQYRCNRCSYVGWTDESALEHASRVCAHCTGKAVLPGKTDLASEAPWMVPFFQEKDLPLTRSCRKYSCRRIYPVCPFCGRVRPTPMAISTIYVKHSISCPTCGDTRSYPEKFMQEFFKQLDIPIIYHPTLDELPWCRPFIYDFYDPGRNAIMETNGMHHYAPVRHYGRTLAQTQERDRAKRQLALAHGIRPECYLELDCRYSTMEHLRGSILACRALRALYPFRESQIDWAACDAAGATSLYWEIFQYKKAHPSITQKELSQRFQVCRSTVSKALKRLSGVADCADMSRMHFT